jgi:hypothetical protein
VTTQTLNAVIARKLILVTTADGAIAQLWAAVDTSAAARVAGRLKENWPAGYTMHICTVGELIAGELGQVAVELDGVALRRGDEALSAVAAARMDGIAAAAAVVRHRGQRWAGWTV